MKDLAMKVKVGILPGTITAPIAGISCSSLGKNAAGTIKKITNVNNPRAATFFAKVCRRPRVGGRLTGWSHVGNLRRIGDYGIGV